MNILITGGSSGIGKYLAKNLAIENNVIICGKSLKKNKYNKESQVLEIKCDVSNERSVKNLVRSVKKTFKKIDVLINCAGIYGEIGDFNKINFDKWKKAIEVNLFGTFLVSKYFFEELKKSKIRKIINFSGGGAFNSFPHYSSYACSKAAVVRLTETIAEEKKLDRIYINCIAPGFVATKIHKQTFKSGIKKVGKKFYEETRKNFKDGGTPLIKILNCVNFLISNKSKNLSGKTISVNFDPWDKKYFKKNISKINKSSMLTMVRNNLS